MCGSFFLSYLFLLFPVWVEYVLLSPNPSLNNKKLGVVARARARFGGLIFSTNSKIQFLFGWVPEFFTHRHTLSAVVGRRGKRRRRVDAKYACLTTI